MIERRALLVETLVRRQITRTGQTYLYRKPTGPRPTSEEMNRFLHKAAQEFDFGPLMTGDQQQARQLATDYFEFLKKSAKNAGIAEDDLVARLKQISPHLQAGFRTFYTYLDAKVKTG